MKFIATLGILALLPLFAGCSGQDYSQYTQAMKEQNMLLQQKADIKENIRADKQRKHEEVMIMYASSALSAASKSSNTADDVTVPLVLLLLEDKWETASLIVDSKATSQPLQKVEAPETTGELIRASTGVALGIAGLGLTAYTSHINGDNIQAAFEAMKGGTTVNVSGENNKAIVDSNKSGSNNSVVSAGDSTITGGQAGDQDNCAEGECEEDEEINPEPPLEMCTGPRGEIPVKSIDPDGTKWVSSGCSCNSYQEYHCQP